MKSVFKFFTQRHLLANALTVMIIFLGLYSLLTINREEFPNADTDMVMVRTTYSGASPEDVELEVTNKLEDALKSVIGIKTMTSTSSENSSSIRIEIDEDEDQQQVYDDIVDAINGVTKLPDDADTPRISQMNPKMKSILEIGLSSSTLSYRELRDYVHEFEKKLLDVPGVAEVGLTGYRDREVRIEVSPDKMEKYGVSMTEIMQAIANRNIRASGGSLESFTDQKNVVTLSKFENPMDVGEVIIRSYSNGAVVTVKDVAAITDDFEEEQSILRMNGKSNISVRVTKSASADIIQTADAVKTLIAEEQAALPSDTVEFLITEDDSVNVRDKFEIVKTNGIIGLVMVFLVLALFLNVRISFWVAMGIPASLMGTLMLLPFFDVELDSLTMAAMVLVIGIIVDDAIVVAENIFQHREKGASPLDAAVNGLHEVALPVFTTVATTILAFIPMFFIKGMIGKFIFVIPLTVIVSLSMSLLESNLILPAHLLPSLRGGKHQKVGRGWFRPIRKRFEGLLYRMLELRYMWLFLTSILLVGAVFYAANTMKFKLMDRGKTVDTVSLTLEMPIGTSLAVTSEKMQELEEIIATFPKTEISSYATSIGSGGFRGAQGEHLGTLTLYFPPASEMPRAVNDIITDVRKKITAVQGLEGLSVGMTFRGPPTGKAVEIMVKGADSTTRDAAVQDIMAFLSQIGGVSDLARDDKAGKDEIAIKLKYPLLARYGLNASDVSQTIRIAYDGQVATSTRYGDEDVDFRVILQRNYRQNMAYLNQLKVANQQGELINLGEVADFEVGPGVYAIYHEDGEPAITITGEVDETVITPLEVMAAVEQHFDFETMRNYPGVRLDIGGEAADSQQAIRDLLFSFALAIIGIYFLLMLLFESMTQPFIVLVTIPFGVTGVILAFLLHGITQASLFAGIGVVGLAGVVVNDALVMVAHLNALRRQRKGENQQAVIAEGAADRLRPVILTTITTVVGLLPLTYGIGGEDVMMGPMAMALGYGLLFATPVTLVLLPCLYMIWADIQGLLVRITRRIRRTSVKEMVLEMEEVG